MFTAKAILAVAVTALTVALWLTVPVVAIAWSYPLTKAVEMLLDDGSDDVA